MNVDPKQNTPTDSAAVLTTAPNSANVLPLDYANPPMGKWTVGSLTYTTAGLAMVIFWLLLGDLGPSFRDRAAGNSANLMLKKFEASNKTISFVGTTIPLTLGLLLAPI